jgi:hypothetical protein
MSEKQTPHRRRDLSRIATQAEVSANKQTDRRTLRYGVDPKGKTPLHLFFWIAAYLFFCLAEWQECVACVMSPIFRHTHDTIQFERRDSDD